MHEITQLETERPNHKRQVWCRQDHISHRDCQGHVVRDISLWELMQPN